MCWLLAFTVFYTASSVSSGGCVNVWCAFQQIAQRKNVSNNRKWEQTQKKFSSGVDILVLSSQSPNMLYQPIALVIGQQRHCILATKHSDCTRTTCNEKDNPYTEHVLSTDAGKQVRGDRDGHKGGGGPQASSASSAVWHQYRHTPTAAAGLWASRFREGTSTDHTPPKVEGGRSSGCRA